MRHKLLSLICAMALCLSATSAWAQESNEQMASYYFQNKEYDKAIELYEPLYNQTQNEFYYQMLYQSYIELERYKDAETLVEKRMKRKPQDLALLVDLGTVQKMRGDKRKSEKSYLSAIDKVGNNSKQVTDLADAFAKIGRYDLGVQTYLEARKKNNNRFLYSMELAALYEKMGDYEKMTAEYFDMLDNNSGFMPSVQIALQRALNETSSDELAEGLRKTIMTRIRQQPDNRCYLEMMIWFSLQQQDFEFALTQAKSIDTRFPEQGSPQVLRVAQIAENNEAYAVAEDAYRHLASKGKDSRHYYDGKIGMLRVKFARINKSHAISPAELRNMEAEYESTLAELGKNANTITLMRNYAYLLAYHDNKLQAAADLLYDIIEMPRLPRQTLGEVKLELGDLLLFAGEIWDASLLYSQVEKANKSDVIGALAKYKNAQLSYYNNDFLWAKSQLDVLRASTSKLIANDAMQLSLLISDNMEEDSTFDMLERYAAADLLMYRNQLDSAWMLYDDITHRTLSHSLFDEILMQKAKIRMKQGRYDEADSLLQQIVDHYAEDILADDALFMLAELNEQQRHDNERARQCYEKLILDYPTSLYIDRARKGYNRLKNL